MDKDRVFSILESVFFSSSQPIPLSRLQALFDDKLTASELKKFLSEFQKICENSSRGVLLEYVGKGWQLRTKSENRDWLLKVHKKRTFRLSRPALEVLTAIAYNQPCPKSRIDEIRGTDSAHLFRTLMECALIGFAGKSDRPGRPCLYKTTDKFLQVFGFSSLEDLPSEEEISKLLPQTPSPARLEDTDMISKAPDVISFREDERENVEIKEALEKIPTKMAFPKDGSAEM